MGCHNQEILQQAAALFVLLVPPVALASHLVLPVAAIAPLSAVHLTTALTLVWRGDWGL